MPKLWGVAFGFPEILRSLVCFPVAFQFVLCYIFPQTLAVFYHLKKMSQDIKLALSDRVREFRGRARLSQDELGELLGVSGNYVSMIELGKKSPGPSLHKLFDLLERSPIYRTPRPGVRKSTESYFGSAEAVPDDSLCSMLSTEILVRGFTEVAEKLSQSDPAKQKRLVSSLRELLDEIEQRLLADQGASRTR